MKRLLQPTFHSPLASALKRFLAGKRAAGYVYDPEAYTLRDLDRFLTGKLSNNDPVITTELIREFLARRGNESETTRTNWLTVVRQFCRFLSLEEPRTAIPKPRYLGIHRSSYIPRVFTQREGCRFVDACERLTSRHGSPMRGPVLGTLFILLYLAGLRASEGVNLTDSDVDLEHGILCIRNTKFGKSRLVPIAPDLVARLQRTRCAVEKYFGKRYPDAPFFPAPYPDHTAYSVSTLGAAFEQVLDTARIPLRSEGRRLRVHDLRHSFAVLRLNLWYKQHENPSALLPALASYMGHVGLSGTQTYLQLTEETFAAVTRRHNARFGHLITEGSDHA